MLEKLKKLLGGDSWPTTVWGGLAVLVATVAYSPELIEFLPDKIEGYVAGICKLLAVTFGLRAFQLTALQAPMNHEAAEKGAATDKKAATKKKSDG